MLNDEQITEMWMACKQGATLGEQVKHFARAIESAALDGQWQPIETAPKDGEQIILRNASWNRVLAHWMPGGHCIEDHPPIDAGWYFWTGKQYDVFKNPEVWRHATQPTPAAQEE